MKVKSESEVAQSCPTLRDPMDYSLPGSSVHGIFQARVLEWGAIAFSSLGARRQHSQGKGLDWNPQHQQRLRPAEFCHEIPWSLDSMWDSCSSLMEHTGELKKVLNEALTSCVYPTRVHNWYPSLLSLQGWDSIPSQKIAQNTVGTISFHFFNILPILPAASSICHSVILSQHSHPIQSSLGLSLCFGGILCLRRSSRVVSIRSSCIF